MCVLINTSDQISTEFGKTLSTSPIGGLSESNSGSSGI